MNSIFSAGAERHTNHWSAVSRVPRGEWLKLRNEFLHDGLVGWRVKRELFEGDVAILQLADRKPLLLRPIAFLLPDTKRNLVVQTGYRRGLDRLFPVASVPPALATIGVDDGASNPITTTTSSSAGSTNRRLISMGTPTRSSDTVTAQGVFTKTGSAASNFVHKRLFLSAAAAGTTDAAGDLAAMTNAFTADWTAFSDFSQTYALTYVGSGS